MPPPGSPSPGSPPGYAPAPPGYGPTPPWGAPVYKPGVVALRPLTLGDFFDGAFKTIRRNPKAMVGLAAAVTTGAMVVPALVTLVLASTVGLTASDPLSEPATGGFTAGLEASVGSGAYAVSSLLGVLFGFVASVVLTGMLVRVVAEAVLGRASTIGQAWTAVRGQLLRLFGLTLLNLLVSLLLLGVPVLVGVLLGVGVGPGLGVGVGMPLLLGGFLVLVWVQFRYFLLAPPALVLERSEVVASLRRGSVLSRDQWWRLFGIYLLTSLVAGLAGQVVAIPLGVLQAIGPAVWDGTTGALVAVYSSYLSQIVVGAITAPFTAAVVALQYVDQRIRKEGLDVQLIAASQDARG